MKTAIRYCLLVEFIFLYNMTQAQETLTDQVPTNVDTAWITSVLPANGPQKALIYSAIMPGLGQAYNQKYWKMPFVYGGFIGMGYIIGYYNEQHSIFKKQLFQSLDDPQFQPPSGASTEQLRTLIDRARRERDYMIVLTGLFYILQIADAHIDAHLREFDVNPDLQVKLKPSIQPIINGSFSTGIGIRFRIDP